MATPAPLLERIVDPETLRFAWHRVAGNRGKPGGDGVSLSRFAMRLDEQLLQLRDEVLAATYAPGPIRQARILRGGKARTLAILPVRDRVLQRAALDVLTPLLDPTFLPCSFGYRPGRAAQDAVERIVRLRDRGLVWVLDADIRDCFGSLDHAVLARLVTEAVPCAATVRLLLAWARTSAAPPRARGIPLGAPCSPLLCNLYLHRLDRSLRRRAFHLVRYADDFVVLCKSESQATWARRQTEKVLSGLALQLNPGKTRIVPFARGFDFLGIRFEGSDYSYEVDGKRVTVDELPPDWFHHHAAGYE